MSASLPDRLRQSTRAAHDRIERDLMPDGAPASIEAYGALLVRFHGYHAAWEPRAARVLDDEAFFGPRRKARLLAQDLAVLDEAFGWRGDDAAPPCPDLPPMASDAEALGAMYVTEGATLGGQIIARQVERSLRLSPERGCAFFASYGREVGPMWRAFRARLADLPSAEDDDAAVAAACRTFDRLHAWLVEGH